MARHFRLRDGMLAEQAQSVVQTFARAFHGKFLLASRPMSSSSFLLPKKLGAYYRRVAVRESGVFAELRKETAKLPMARMQIAPEQGQLMAMLVKLIQARRCIEVGVFTGYSSLAVASALPDEGEVLACDV